MSSQPDDVPLDWSQADARAVDLVRVLAMDAVQQAGSGHPGTVMSLAPAAYVLFQHVLRHDPADPGWPGRDRLGHPEHGLTPGVDTTTGTSARVVSMPCVEWFSEQDASYQQEVLPPGVRARVCVEAGIALGWRAFAGDLGECVSMEHFGASAAYQTLYAEFGITAQRVAEAARTSLARQSAGAGD